MAGSAATSGATTGGSTTVPATTEAEIGTLSPVGEVLREIARGGITGILVGIFVAGIGGRLVMRLATILHEDTVGRFTEMDAVIGAITLEGTMALLIFGGLGMGLMAGMVWVIVRPWLPGEGLGRALVTGLLAVTIGSPSLIQRTNPDFIILDYDPVVVAMLVGLVFAVGFSMALTDGWLDRHLPRAGRGAGVATTVYFVITLLGLILIVPLAVAILLDQPDYRAPIRTGFALLVVGACTLTWWLMRVRGSQADPPRWLMLTGRTALVVTAVLGVVTILPHIRSAAGLL